MHARYGLPSIFGGRGRALPRVRLLAKVFLWHGLRDEPANDNRWTWALLLARRRIRRTVTVATSHELLE